MYVSGVAGPEPANDSANFTRKPDGRMIYPLVPTWKNLSRWCRGKRVFPGAMTMCSTTHTVCKLM